MKAPKIELFLTVVLSVLASMALGQLAVDALENGFWGANEKVTTLPPQDPHDLDIAADGKGNVYAVWQDYDIYSQFDYRWSVHLSVHPKGGTWQAEEMVATVFDYSPSPSPAVAADNFGNAHILWRDQDDSGADGVYYCLRASQGSCDTRMKVSDGSVFDWYSDEGGPDIAVDSFNTAHAVWADSRKGNSDIFYSQRLPGESWSKNVQINDDTGSARQFAPAIAAGPDGSVYAVWVDQRYDNPDIFFSFRPPEGSWTENVKVNDEFATAWPSQSEPDLAVDRFGNAYAMWIDGRNLGLSDVFFSFRPSGGTWSPNVQVDSEAGTAQQHSPKIAVDGNGYAYAIWTDRRYIQTDIYSSVRSPTGEWGVNIKVNDDLEWAYQDSPALTVDALGNIYAIWRDTREGNNQIYSSFRVENPWPQYVYLPLMLHDVQ